MSVKVLRLVDIKACAPASRKMKGRIANPALRCDSCHFIPPNHPSNRTLAGLYGLGTGMPAGILSRNRISIRTGSDEITGCGALRPIQVFVEKGLHRYVPSASLRPVVVVA